MTSLFALAVGWLRQRLRGGRHSPDARSRLRAVWLGPMLFLAMSSTAHAQAYQCRMPKATVAPFVERDGPVRMMPVTGYTLALSWSPEFCKPREGQRAHALQCSGRHGRFGLVVHGLWPDGARSWPQWCPTRRQPTGQQVARQLCMSPSTRLVARQWAKHGSCTGWTPEGYYKVTRILFDSLQIPDFDRLSRRGDLDAGAVRQAFADANGKHWRREDVGLKLNERGWLEELRLCYGKDFMPTRCTARQYGPGNDEPVKIWRGL